MYKLIRPEKDTTIYEYAEEVNAGIDEILELNTRKGVAGRDFAGEYLPSRILIQFPDTGVEFSGIAEDGPNGFGSFGFNTVDRTPGPATAEFGTGPPNAFAFLGEEVAPDRPEPEPEPDPVETEDFDPSAWLRMYFANGQGMPYEYEIEAYALDSEWKEGRGRLENLPSTDEAANWIQRLPSTDWNTAGGDFSSQPVARQNFRGEDPDLMLRLNTILSQEPQNGILLRRADEDLEQLSELKFFSKQTRTIYVPHILLGVDNYQFDTSEADPVEVDNFTAYVANLQNRYEQGQYRFEVSVEEKYEQRQFLGIRPTARTDSIGSQPFLPQRSLRYEVRDRRTGLEFFPFDERYTSVSYSGGRHFFDLDTSQLLPKRDYELRLKYVDPETGNEEIFDNEQTFRVE
jgi:hypothetical protein